MKRLKELRQLKGFTLKELSEELKISPQVISRYELEQHEADYETTYKIAKYFDVSIEYLLGFSEFYYPQSFNSDYSADEQHFIEDFRQLDFYGKKLVKQMLDALLHKDLEDEEKRKRN